MMAGSAWSRFAAMSPLVLRKTHGLRALVMNRDAPVVPLEAFGLMATARTHQVFNDDLQHIMLPKTAVHMTDTMPRCNTCSVIYRASAIGICRRAPWALGRDSQ